MALPPPTPSSTCLVTGASSGIGADIARELALRGHGVTLVARREDRLEELAEELRDEHGVRAETVGADIADADARQGMLDEVEGKGLTVEVLINNAGFGTAGTFWEIDPQDELNQVRLNIEAVVALCSVYVPKLVARGRGAVLNVASTAAFQPLPYQSSYAATKAFVLSFTEGLATELQGTGAQATALCPGPTPTEFGEVAGIPGFDDMPGFIALESREVARVGVEAMEKGKRSVIPGLANQAGAIGGRLTPRSLLLPLVRRAHPSGK